MKETTTNPQATPEPEYHTLQVSEDGRNYQTVFTKKFRNRKPWERPDPQKIKTFIPGSVLKVLVKAGQSVKAGDELIVFEAMKMHNIIRAPFAGKVSAIPVKAGDKLPRGALMLTIRKA